jgi:hypothetical protein
MQRLLKSAFVVACVILLPSAAYAQASIAGVARDASGAVLPGVTVEAASPALIEKVRSVVSDGSGQYRIVNLRPGTYSVTFTLTGFNTVKRDGIELAGAVTATVNADMRVGGVEETILVTRRRASRGRAGRPAAARAEQQTPYLTQLKLLAAYTIPAIGVQASGTFQSVPGPLIQANAVYTSAQVAGSLGRPLAGAATAQVNVIAPGNAYGDRLNQLDFRVGKLLRFGRTKTALNVDIYNVFNDNAALTENASFAVFRQPLLVLNPRLVKFSVNLDF